jgi:hypothetical protein
MQRKIEYTINFRNKTPIEDGGDRYTLEDFKDRITEMMKQAGMDVEFGHCQISEFPILHRTVEDGEKEGNDVGHDNDHDAAGSGSPEDHRRRIPRL